MRQPIVPNCPVITLRISILLGLAGLDEIDADSSSGSPSHGHGDKVFRTVVTADCIRSPRHSIIRSSDLMTRSDGSEKSTSIPKPFRLKPSITLDRRMRRPSES